MGDIRMHRKNDIHFVTSRCEQEQFFMIPRENITRVIAAWFARAMAEFGQGLEVYAFVFLSNHFHLLVRDTGGSLAAFMTYFKGNVARAVNEQLGRRGHFWAVKYDDMIVDGEDAFLDRYAYTLCNAVKAGLVERAADWKGFSSLPHALSEKPLTFSMVDRTRLNSATRRGQKVDLKRFTNTYTFSLTVPPMWAGKTRGERRGAIRELCQGAERVYRAKRDNKPALGMPAVLRQRFTDRPTEPSRRPRVRFFTFCKARRKELQALYREFVGRYLTALDRYVTSAVRGIRTRIPWPPGSYPPSAAYPVRFAETG